MRLISRGFLVALLLMACTNAQSQHGDSAVHHGARVEGDLRMHELRSKVFGNVRMLRVLLPDEYEALRNRTRRYPVLYLNDGQNLFDSTTSVLNPMEWRVDETVRALGRDRVIPPLIVVGIDNAGRRGRFKEYFPYVDEYLHPPEPDPQGKRYPEFLLNEVVPFIESRYRVSRDPTDRGIGGSSAGALAALYAVVARPGTFGRLLIESPSLYVDSSRILREAAAVRRWPERIFLGVGTNESNRRSCDASSEDNTLLDDVRSLQSLLRSDGVDSGRVHLAVTPCGRHDEAAWAARFPEALRFLYPR